MKMVRYRPNSLLDELQKEFFNFTPWTGDMDKSLVETSDWVPRVDIKEEPDQFLVYADVPGVDPNDIDIFMEGNILTVKGKRESISEEKEKDFSRIERTYGTFYRQFTLPETAVSEKIAAKSKHGVLEIIIPKQEKAQSRTISVKVEQ